MTWMPQPVPRPPFGENPRRVTEQELREKGERARRGPGRKRGFRDRLRRLFRGTS